jgi:hypothetical protein
VIAAALQRDTGDPGSRRCHLIRAVGKAVLQLHEHGRDLRTMHRVMCHQLQ